jgi:pyruvate,orthophosphate dikinase
MSPASNPVVLFVGDQQAGAAGVTPASVGAKGYNLMRMHDAGLPVPPAFVVSTEICRQFLAGGERLPAALTDVLAASIRRLENTTGRSFGGRRNPLLISVRSGAPVSMPGMMESILNVGLNDLTVNGLIRLSGNPHLAWDCYRRLVESYAGVVHGCSMQSFDALAQPYLDPVLLPSVRDLDTLSLRALLRDAMDRLQDVTGKPFPQDPMEQLGRCLAAVFRSWNSPRAVAYRRMNGIDDDLGTAVTVQAMVFGNAGGTSGSGVGFTRDPATGGNDLYLDFLFNAQGEDVVSGRRKVSDDGHLRTLLPGVHAELRRMKALLESEFRDLQDFEFTVQAGELFLLQTRSGKRTPWAALKVAVDMVEEGLIDVPTALERLRDLDLTSIESQSLATAEQAEAIACATPASIGVASGMVALDSDAACRLARGGEPVILVREDIDTDDVQGMAAARGVLTAHGGRTSHAAVVARQMNKVCLVGCGELGVEAARRHCRIGGVGVHEGEWISLDANSGHVYAGRMQVLHERPTAWLDQVEAWRRETSAA